MIRKLLVLLCLILPAAARAEWREATSTNFAVYTEGSEQLAREFAAKLERYNYVLRRFHNVREPAQAPRFRVFLLENIEAVQRMASARGSGIGGYYVRDARALMFIGMRAAGAQRGFEADIVLFHEYVHHFMYQYFPAAYPVWYSEGYPEFWGSIRFLENDVVEIGHPQELRFRSFVQGRWVPLRQLLVARTYADIPESDLIYAQGWLLSRYMFENTERRRQIQAYLNAINEGMSYEEAMNTHIGRNASQLNDELFEYASRGRYNVIRLPFRTIDVGTITVRTLSPAEQALIEQEIKLSQGVRHTEIAERAAQIRRIAGSFPDDPFALNLLAEAEQLAGNLPAATAAVDRLLRVSPNHPRGLMRKGELEVERLRAAGSTDRAAWSAARQYLTRAMQAAPNDPLVHEAYYDSFTAQGVLPPDEAQNALYSAHELAPSDDELSYKLARDFEQRNMIREAIAIIRPVAFRTPLRRGESDSERRERERQEERYRDAGTTRHETALEMLTRLEQRLSEARPAAAQRQ
jgi:tetratricopeptide (TPR) repeat protein